MRWVLGIVALLVLSSCGGGGGEGGPSSTGLRVFHTAIDFPMLDLVGEDGIVLSSGISFGQYRARVGLTEGAKVLHLQTRGRATRLGSLSLPVYDGGNVSALVYGNTDGFGFRAALLPPLPSEYSQGMGALRVVHGVVGAAGVDLSVDGRVLSADFGAASEWMEFSAQTLRGAITRSVDGIPLGQIEIPLLAGEGYTVVVGGLIGTYVDIGWVRDGL